MNEYSIYYLNGIITHLTANDWKDAINEAKINAQRKEFNTNIKMIIDEDNVIIRNINIENYTFTFSENIIQGEIQTI